MFLRCPKCRVVSRLSKVVSKPRVGNYICPACQNEVRIEMSRDEVESTSSADSVEKSGHKKVILVADDNERVRTFVFGLLRSAGYDVLEAEDGLQALNLIKEKHPDLILLNLMLPLMTGYDVVEETQKDERLKGTPILLMSDVVSEREVFGTLDSSGIVGFLDKRQIKDTLVPRVQEILSKQAHQVA